MARIYFSKNWLILIGSSLAYALLGCGGKEGKADQVVSEVQSGDSAINKDVVEEDSEPSFIFKNVPAAGIDVSGIFKLEVAIKNYPADVVWSVGATPRRESTASSDVGFVLFDQALDATVANFDTFLVEKNTGTYYLFAVMIYPTGFTKTIYSDGQLRINNTGVPRIENPLFFTDALGNNRKRPVGEINAKECCVILQNVADDADGKLITFDVPLSKDPFEYHLDLVTGATAAAANVLGDFSVEDDAANEIRHVTAHWQPTGLPKAANYQLRIKVLNTATKKETSVESSVFGLYADNEAPDYTSLTAIGGVLEAKCSSCHTVANNREFIWDDFASFMTWDVRNDNRGISHRTLIRGPMDAGFMPSGGTLTDSEKLELQLYLQAGSPAPPAPPVPPG